MERDVQAIHLGFKFCYLVDHVLNQKYGPVGFDDADARWDRIILTIGEGVLLKG